MERILNIYTLMYLIPALLVLLRIESKKILLLLVALYTLIIGFRHQVGGDWENYLIIYNQAGVLGFFEFLSFTEPGYALVNWISYKIGGGIYLVNLVCGALFMYGLWKFCSREPNPILAFLIAVPYLVIVVAMGYTRQSVAIGLVLLAMYFFFEKKNYFAPSLP